MLLLISAETPGITDIWIHFKLSAFYFNYISASLYIDHYLFFLSTGWTMVFKVVSNLSTDIYQLWSSSDSLNENKTEALNTNSLLKEHYKNHLVQNWQAANHKGVYIWRDARDLLPVDNLAPPPPSKWIVLLGFRRIHFPRVHEKCARLLEAKN